MWGGGGPVCKFFLACVPFPTALLGGKAGGAFVFARTSGKPPNSLGVLKTVPRVVVTVRPGEGPLVASLISLSREIGGLGAVTVTGELKDAKLGNVLAAVVR